MSWNKRRKRITSHEHFSVRENETETAADEEVKYGRWIHDRVPSKVLPGAFDYLPSCICSVCGYHTEMPLGVCPRCDAVMDLGAAAEEVSEERPAEEPEKTPGHAYWIHHRRHSDSYARGYYSLPVCDCSNCGYVAGIEKPICPNCRSIMDAPVPDHIEAPYED